MASSYSDAPLAYLRNLRNQQDFQRMITKIANQHWRSLPAGVQARYLDQSTPGEVAKDSTSNAPAVGPNRTTAEKRRQRTQSSSLTVPGLRSKAKTKESVEAAQSRAESMNKPSTSVILCPQPKVPPILPSVSYPTPESPPPSLIPQTTWAPYPTSDTPSMISSTSYPARPNIAQPQPNPNMSRHIDDLRRTAAMDPIVISSASNPAATVIPSAFSDSDTYFDQYFPPAIPDPFPVQIEQQLGVEHIASHINTYRPDRLVGSDCPHSPYDLVPLNPEDPQPFRITLPGERVTVDGDQKYGNQQRQHLNANPNGFESRRDSSRNFIRSWDGDIGLAYQNPEGIAFEAESSQPASNSPQREDQQTTFQGHHWSAGIYPQHPLSSPSE